MRIEFRSTTNHQLAHNCLKSDTGLCRQIVRLKKQAYETNRAIPYSTLTNGLIMNSMHPTSKLLIFTDLDGCLLDHNDYSFEPAAALLQKLNTLHIPVIPATSKTESEVLHLRKIINNTGPFIIENGAAVYIPMDYFPEKPDDVDEVDEFWVKTFTEPREHWTSLIARTGFGRDKFQTFSESSVSDIVKLTGLTHDAAVRASHRGYGEPVAWHGSPEEKQQFVTELQRLGANVMQGGRFLHVSGNCDKGLALSWLADQYKKALHAPILSIAIGDSQNDVSMLELANIAVLIPSPAHALLRLDKPQHFYNASHFGPDGWAESVSMILNTLNIN